MKSKPLRQLLSVNRDQSLPALLASFKEAALARGQSPKRLRTFSGHIGKLATFMVERKLPDLASLSPKHLQAFNAWLMEYRADAPGKSKTKLSAVSRVSVIGGLRSFLKWAYRNGIMAADLSKHLVLPKLAHPLPRDVPTLKHIATVIRFKKNQHDPTGLAFRDATIIAMLFACGLRCQELCDLRIDDVDLDEREVRVLCGKGGLGRTVPIAVWARDVVRLYIQNVRPKLVKTSNNCFYLSYSGKPLSYEDISRMLRRACKEAGLDRAIVPHALRHAFCLYLLKGGASIRVIAELAGHKSLTMTARYTKLTVADLAHVVKKSHPRGQ